MNSPFPLALVLRTFLLHLFLGACANAVVDGTTYRGAFVFSSPFLKTQLKRRNYMALTEEFIQIKGGKETQIIRHDHNNTPNPTNTEDFRQQRPSSDTLGYIALSKVKSLARSTGISERFGSDTSTRSEFIDWQRENLRDVRREVGSGTLLRERSTMKQSGGTRKTEVGVREALIKALPSNNGGKKQNGRGKNKSIKKSESNDDPTTISTALQTLERDMTLLDNLASLQPQLSLPEVGLLLGAVTASGIGPIVFPGTSVTEVLAPAAAACK